MTDYVVIEMVDAAGNELNLKLTKMPDSSVKLNVYVNRKDVGHQWPIVQAEGLGIIAHLQKLFHP